MLARTHTGQVGLPLTPESILVLDADLYAYVPGEGGQWKQRDNVIWQVLPDGRGVARFVPLPADQTPDAMEEEKTAVPLFGTTSEQPRNHLNLVLSSLRGLGVFGAKPGPTTIVPTLSFVCDTCHNTLFANRPRRTVPGGTGGRSRRILAQRAFRVQSGR